MLLRWLSYYLFIDDVYRARLPSLIGGAVFTLVGVQIWMVGFLGDLQAASRRLLAESRVRERVRALTRGDG